MIAVAGSNKEKAEHMRRERHGCRSRADAGRWMAG